MSHCRCQGTTLQPKALYQPQPYIACCPVPLKHRQLQHIILSIADSTAIHPLDRQGCLFGYNLIRHQPDYMSHLRCQRQPEGIQVQLPHIDSMLQV